MKKLFLFTVMVIFSTLVLGQTGEYYYWYKGEKQLLKLKPDKTFLLLDLQTDEESISDNLQVNKTNIERIRKVELGATYKQSRTKLRNNYWIIVKSESEQFLLVQKSYSCSASNQRIL